MTSIIWCSSVYRTLLPVSVKVFIGHFYMSITITISLYLLKTWTDRTQNTCQFQCTFIKLKLCVTQNIPEQACTQLGWQSASVKIKQSYFYQPHCLQAFPHYPQLQPPFPWKISHMHLKVQDLENPKDKINNVNIFLLHQRKIILPHTAYIV